MAIGRHAWSGSAASGGAMHHAGKAGPSLPGSTGQVLLPPHLPLPCALPAPAPASASSVELTTSPAPHHALHTCTTHLQEGKPVEMENFFSRFGLDIIGKAVFNYDFDSLTHDDPVIQVGGLVGCIWVACACVGLGFGLQAEVGCCVRAAVWLCIGGAGELAATAAGGGLCSVPAAVAAYRLHPLWRAPPARHSPPSCCTHTHPPAATLLSSAGCVHHAA